LLLEDSEADAELVTHVLQRAGMRTLLERVASKDEFILALREFAPNVVLCDHAVAAFNALGALEARRALRPSAALIVVSGALDERATVACMRAGADDIVPKTDLSRLPEAIVAATVVRRPLEKLSPRQLEVLRLVAEGLTTPQIARRFTLSVKTIETHRSELMRRLDIHDVVGLVRYAVRVGLVSANPAVE